ncbi:MAG TPA: SMI1/KNR4 family protein [Polyangiaceae bacterium]|jgi:hypothetical protein
MTTTPSLPELLRNSWRESGTVLRPGVTKEDIERFEKQHNVRVPEALSQYFQTVDGMEDGDTDAHDIRFWRLAEVQPVSAEIPDADLGQFPGYFVFADYSVWAHGYAVRLSQGANDDVVIVGGDHPVLVASSFKEFLAFYVHQPDKLF